MFNPFKTNRRLQELEKEVVKLQELVQKHATTVAHELYKLKNPHLHAECNLQDPLTPEQEEIIKEFNKNIKLPEQIRRGFASGGYVGHRAAMFAGGMMTEQTRQALTREELDVEAARLKDLAVESGVYDVKVEINGADARLENFPELLSSINQVRAYPGTCYKRPHLDLPDQRLATGFRDPQPPPRQKAMDELIREDNAYMDEQAQFDADLQELIDDTKPKE